MIKLAFHRVKDLYQVFTSSPFEKLIKEIENLSVYQCVGEYVSDNKDCFMRILQSDKTSELSGYIEIENTPNIEKASVRFLDFDDVFKIDGRGRFQINKHVDIDLLRSVAVVKSKHSEYELYPIVEDFTEDSNDKSPGLKGSDLADSEYSYITSKSKEPKSLSKKKYYKWRRKKYKIGYDICINKLKSEIWRGGICCEITNEPFNTLLFLLKEHSRTVNIYEIHNMLNNDSTESNKDPNINSSQVYKNIFDLRKQTIKIGRLQGILKTRPGYGYYINENTNFIIIQQFT